MRLQRHCAARCLGGLSQCEFQGCPRPVVFSNDDNCEDLGELTPTTATVLMEVMLVVVDDE